MIDENDMSLELRLAVGIADFASRSDPDVGSDDLDEIRAKAGELASSHPESDAQPEEIALVLQELRATGH